MNTSLDCIPCILRQTLEAARVASSDPAEHEAFLREVLTWAGKMDLRQSPPAITQQIHHRLREISGKDDLYRAVKDRQNLMAMDMLPDLSARVKAAKNPLLMSARLAIAGNIIDLGVNGKLTEADVHLALKQALTEPLSGDPDRFQTAVREAHSILYLADNAGEIAFDRLLIEQILPKRVTLAVRGAPAINDATCEDARQVGLDQMVEVIGNGSDAPGTILSDCSPEFYSRFRQADLIIAKGQGNFETLCDEPGNIFFLFKVKCPLVSELVHQPVGSHMLVRSRGTQGELAG